MKRLTYHKLVEIPFGSQSNFNAISQVTIPSDIIAVRSMIVKIKLPTLPEGLTYKKYVIYDLIQNIELMIAQKSFFNYTSRTLALKDMVISNRFTNLTQFISADEKNVVYYPIHFHECLRQTQYIIHEDLDLPFDVNYFGLRMIDLSKQTVSLTLTFAALNTLVENPELLPNETEQLGMQCSILINHYVDQALQPKLPDYYSHSNILIQRVNLPLGNRVEFLVQKPIHILELTMSLAGLILLVLSSSDRDKITGYQLVNQGDLLVEHTVLSDLDAVSRLEMDKMKLSPEIIYHSMDIHGFDQSSPQIFHLHLHIDPSHLNKRIEIDILTRIALFIEYNNGRWKTDCSNYLGVKVLND